MASDDRQRFSPRALGVQDMATRCSPAKLPPQHASVLLHVQKLCVFAHNGNPTLYTCDLVM